MSKSKKSQEVCHTQEVFERVNIFADTTGRFAVDRLLRQWGFKIYARPRNREPVWVLYGKYYKHSEAVKEVSFRALEDAVDEEYWYKLCSFGWE